MSAKELNIEEQNRLILLRKAMENAETIILDPLFEKDIERIKQEDEEERLRLQPLLQSRVYST